MTVQRHNPAYRFAYHFKTTLGWSVSFAAADEPDSNGPVTGNDEGRQMKQKCNCLIGGIKWR